MPEVKRNIPGATIGVVLLLICIGLTAVTIRGIEIGWIEGFFCLLWALLGGVAIYGIVESLQKVERNDRGQRMYAADHHNGLDTDEVR